jgi:subfamily B ATP-binding cassette protein MsbA
MSKPTRSLPEQDARPARDTLAPTSREVYLRLLGYVRPYKRMFLLAILGMVLTAAVEPLFPALLKPLLDGGEKIADPGQFWFYPFAVVGIFLLRGALSFVTGYALSWVSFRVVMDMRLAMFDRLVRLPTRYYEDHSSGILISKVAWDVTGVSQAATSVLTVLVRDSLMMVALLGWMFWLNWKLSLVSLILAPILAWAVARLSRRLRGLSRQAQHAMGDITHVLEETIECQKVVKIFGGEDYEAQRFTKVNAAQRNNAMRMTVVSKLIDPLIQLMASVALAVVIAITLWQVAHGETTLGSFISFVTAMLLLMAPLKRLTEVNGPLQRGLAAAESVFELLAEEPEPAGGQPLAGRAQGGLVFEDVYFAYPTANRDALAGISFEVEPGETVALVGPSGGGKTTLASLVPHLIAPTGGRILLDGMDIGGIALASLRANIALVSQEVLLFDDTVSANIAYGAMRDAPREAIEAAARAAHAYDFIQALPQGFDTPIGENGARLSGGQRQRIAIARAILKDAPILILDEATSALDNESERHVQAALEVLMQGRTTLVIAHRLSTIERADRILVLAQGRKVEEGSHAQLLAAEGIYARLYRNQFSVEAGDT